MILLYPVPAAMAAVTVFWALAGTVGLAHRSSMPLTVRARHQHHARR